LLLKPTDERRLELIKGGKGAAKLRESRAEAIIRSRKGRGREAVKRAYQRYFYQATGPGAEEEA